MFVKDCISWEGPHAAAQEEHEEEKAEERTHSGLTEMPIPQRCFIGGGRRIVNEVEPGKKGDGGRWF